MKLVQILFFEYTTGILWNSMDKTLPAKNSVIHLLRHYVFLYISSVRMSGSIVNSNAMTLSLSREEVQNVKNQCLEM